MLDSARHAVKPNEINILAFTVLRDLEQIDHTQETRLSRQLWTDIRKTDRRDRIHLDLTFFHTVPGANLDVGTLPYSNAAGDGASSHALSEPLGEDHATSLRLLSSAMPVSRGSRTGDRPERQAAGCQGSGQPGINRRERSSRQYHPALPTRRRNPSRTHAQKVAPKRMPK